MLIPSNCSYGVLNSTTGECICYRGYTGETCNSLTTKEFFVGVHIMVILLHLWLILLVLHLGKTSKAVPKFRRRALKTVLTAAAFGAIQETAYFTSDMLRDDFGEFNIAWVVANWTQLIYLLFAFAAHIQVLFYWLSITSNSTALANPGMGEQLSRGRGCVVVTLFLEIIVDAAVRLLNTLYAFGVLKDGPGLHRMQTVFQYGMYSLFSGITIVVTCFVIYRLWKFIGFLTDGLDYISGKSQGSMAPQDPDRNLQAPIITRRTRRLRTLQLLRSYVRVTLVVVGFDIVFVILGALQLWRLYRKFDGWWVAVLVVMRQAVLWMQLASPFIILCTTLGNVKSTAEGPPHAMFAAAGKDPHHHHQSPAGPDGQDHPGGPQGGATLRTTEDEGDDEGDDTSLSGSYNAKFVPPPTW